MFCPKCGAQTPDDAQFCSKCGAKLPTQVEDAEKPAAPEPPTEPAAPEPPAKAKAPEPVVPPTSDAPKPPAPDAPKPPEGTTRAANAPVPPAGVTPAASAAAAAPDVAENGKPTSPTTPKKGKKGLVIGIVAAVVAFAVAFFAVRALMPSGPWQGSMMLEGVDLSATFDKEFGITYDGTTMTVYDQDETISGTIANVTEGDDQLFYELTDIDWGSWGTELFQSSTVRNKQLTVIVPKGASTRAPYGRWGMVVAATDMADDDYPLFVRSTMLELDEDGSGAYEFAAEWGQESDVAVADPTSSSYDPASSGWKHRFTATGSKGNYLVDILDDTFTLTFE